MDLGEQNYSGLTAIEVRNPKTVTPLGIIGDMPRYTEISNNWGNDSGSGAFAKYAKSLEEARFIVPKLPNVSPEHLTVHKSHWMFTSDTRLDEIAPYMLEPFGGIAFGEIANDFIIHGHNGHGVNSYAFGLVGRIGNLIIAQQELYGGAYMDNEIQRYLVNEQTKLWNNLVSTYEPVTQWNSRKYFVLFSSFRNLAMILVEDPTVESLTESPFVGWKIIQNFRESEMNFNDSQGLSDSKDPIHEAATQYLSDLVQINERGRELQSEHHTDGIYTRESNSKIYTGEDIERVSIQIDAPDLVETFGIKNFILVSSKYRQYVIVERLRDSDFDALVERVSANISSAETETARGRVEYFMHCLISERMRQYGSRQDFILRPALFDPIYEEPDYSEPFALEHEVEMMLRQLNYSEGFTDEFFEFECLPLDPIHVDMAIESNGSQFILFANFKKMYAPMETGPIPISFDRHQSLMVFPSDGLFAEFDMETFDHLMQGGRARRRVQTHLALPMIHFLCQASIGQPLNEPEMWHLGPQENPRFSIVDLGALDHECVFAPPISSLPESTDLDFQSEIEVRYFSISNELGFIYEIGHFGTRGRYRIVNGRWKLVTPFEDSLQDGSFSYMVRPEHLKALLDWIEVQPVSLEDLEQYEVKGSDDFDYLDLSRLRVAKSEEPINVLEALIGRSPDPQGVMIALYEFEVDLDRKGVPYYDNMDRFYVFSDDRDQVILYSPNSDVKIIEEIVSAMEFEGAPRNNAIEWCEWLAAFAENFTCQRILVKEVQKSPDALSAFIFRALKDPSLGYLSEYSEVYPPVRI